MMDVMSLELAAQVCALVGTSALIFIATQPPSNPLQDYEAGLPEELRGAKRFSSYHQKRYYRRLDTASSSMGSSVSSSTDNSSA